MTPADLARQNAIAFECKKDGLRQTQAGTWKVTFTVLDMDERLTKAFPGTRYQAVLVEIDDSEMPVTGATAPVADRSVANGTVSGARNPGGDNALKTHAQNHLKEASQDEPVPAKPRMDWRELQPAAQAGIRCADPVFKTFLKEEHYPHWNKSPLDAAVCVRLICGVESRSELGSNHRARVIWKQLDDQFQAWQRVGA